MSILDNRLPGSIGESFVPTTWAVFRHELRLLLYSPFSYLFMGGFWVALVSAVFLISDLYASDEASIRLMLVFMPWIAIVLVPSLAMGMWTEEKIDRSAELVLTLPLQLGSIIVGKFLAGYAVLLVFLVFTLPVPATVIYLGEPDLLRIVAGYAGMALFLGLFFSIALFAAALINDRIGALVVGLTLLFFTQLIGWDVFTDVLKPLLPASILDTVTLYSPRTWLLRMGDGLVQLAALIYFVGGTVILLSATGLVVLAHQRRIKISGFCFFITGFLAVIAAVPVIANSSITIDMTAEKEYSLDSGTKKILGRLPPGTAATLYWSSFETSIPVAIKSHARRVRNLLKNLAAHAGENLTIKELNPQPDSDAELQALDRGLRRVPMSSGDHFYFGLVVEHGGRVGNVPYFDIQRDRFLEYDIAVALNGLSLRETPKIGIISPLLPSQAAVGQVQGLSFMAELKRAYDIAVIPFFKKQLPDGLAALLIVDASILRHEMLYAIDQFVMKGGSLVVMLDPYVRFNRGSNVVNPSPSREINDISDLLLKWGIRYLGDAVVGDARAASPVSDNQETRMSFPYWMRIRQSGLASNHPTTAHLKEVFMVEPGALKINALAGAISLIFSSSESGSQPRLGYSDRSPRQLTTEFESDGVPRVIAAAINGSLESSFARAPARKDGEASSRQHIVRSKGRTKIFAIADVDWLFDPFSLQQIDVGGRTVVRPLNDNLSFLLNLVEYATGDVALTSIRSRGQLQRPFTRVHDLFQKVEKQYRQEEAALVRRVAEVEANMTAAFKVVGNKDIDKLPQSMRDEIKKFRSELIDARKRLRNLRLLIRIEVESLGRALTIINFIAGLVLILLFWSVVNVRRRRAGRVWADASFLN